MDYKKEFDKLMEAHKESNDIIQKLSITNNELHERIMERFENEDKLKKRIAELERELKGVRSILEAIQGLAQKGSDGTCWEKKKSK